MLRRATFTARPDLTKMPCRTRRFSKRTARPISRGLTSCAQCGVSIRACPAASTCISATERSLRRGIRRFSACARTRIRSPGCEIVNLQSHEGELSARIEELVGRIQSIADPLVRTNVVNLLQAAMDLHGKGLERMLQVVAEGEDAGQRTLRRFSSDELIAGLLTLHGLHPDSLEFRVEQAVLRLQQELRDSGEKLELKSLDGATLHLRLTVNAGGCSSKITQLEMHLRDELAAVAPDLDRVEIERVLTRKESRGGLVQLQAAPAAAREELLCSDGS